MPAPEETPVLFEGWEGVNITIDPALLSQAILRRSRNWVPGDTGVLEKRKGITPYLDIGSTTALSGLFVALDTSNVRHVYAVQSRAAQVDRVVVSQNGGPFSPITGGNFASAGLRYGVARLGDALYYGNGIDPIKRVGINGSGADLAALGVTNETGAVASTQNAAAGSTTDRETPPGTYSYCWAVYDTSTKLFVSRSPAKTIDVIAAQFLRFTAPTTVLPANQLYKLFLTRRNLPMELATDQFPGGLAPGVVRDLSTIGVEGALVPVMPDKLPTGRFLLTRGSRIWTSGQLNNEEDRHHVHATSVLVPNLEQDIFNVGDFWPARNQVKIPYDVTGMGVVNLVGTQRSPGDPIAVFTESTTHFILGDIGADNFELVDVSSVIGCVAHESIAQIPGMGLMFMGYDSVYLLSPSGNIMPIGAPISKAIRSIASDKRSKVVGCYHDGFYNIFITTGSAQKVNEEFWQFDVRQGFKTAWWGPHRIPNAACRPTTLAVDNTTAPPTMYGGTNAGEVSKHKQDTYTDRGSIYMSSLLSGMIPGAYPFQRKIVTGLRALLKTNRNTEVSVGLEVDGAVRYGGSLVFDGNVSTTWDAPWNAEWESSDYIEGQIMSPDSRPRGRVLGWQLEHTSPEQCQIRNVELTYLPVPRPRR